jgi:hypothetical protein
MDTLQAFRPQLELNFAESLFVGNAVGGKIGTKEDFDFELELERMKVSSRE